MLQLFAYLCRTFDNIGSAFGVFLEELFSSFASRLLNEMLKMLDNYCLLHNKILCEARELVEHETREQKLNTKIPLLLYIPISYLLSYALYTIHDMVRKLEIHMGRKNVSSWWFWVQRICYEPMKNKFHMKPVKMELKPTHSTDGSG